LEITHARNLEDYEIEVTWNDDAAELVELRNDAFLGSTGRTILCSSPKHEPGRALLRCSSVGRDLSGPDGTGALATVYLRPRTSTSPLAELNDAAQLRVKRHAIDIEVAAIPQTAVASWPCATIATRGDEPWDQACTPLCRPGFWRWWI
jgi:hypothetical protein